MMVTIRGEMAMVMGRLSQSALRSGTSSCWQPSCCAATVAVSSICLTQRLGSDIVGWLLQVDASPIIILLTPCLSLRLSLSADSKKMHVQTPPRF